jgi:hypothetical protein
MYAMHADDVLQEDNMTEAGITRARLVNEESTLRTRAKRVRFREALRLLHSHRYYLPEQIL